MRLLVVAPGVVSAFLAACASSSSTRYVLLESESYRCGAAEGLGCGLALAPKLHEIDALEGVARSSVSWDGCTFRIELSPGADPERVGAAVAATLEGEACCVVEPRGQAAPAQGEQWFDAQETVALSRHEAGVIAAGFSAAVATEVPLAEDDAARLHDVLREELEHAFERAHAAGGGVERLWEQIPTGWPKLEARLGEFLTPEQREQVLAVLSRELGD